MEGADAVAAYLRRLEPLADIPTFVEDAHNVAPDEALHFLAAARARCDGGQLPLPAPFVLAALQWRACHPCWPRFKRPLTVPAGNLRSGKPVCPSHDAATLEALKRSAGQAPPVQREYLSCRMHHS